MKDFQSCGKFFKDLHFHVIHRMIRLMEMSVERTLTSLFYR